MVEQKFLLVHAGIKVGIKGGWLGQIQSRKMAGRFKLTKLSAYIANQRSYADATPCNYISTKSIYTNGVF